MSKTEARREGRAAGREWRVKASEEDRERLDEYIALTLGLGC